jgi:hypothetical protein
VSAERGSIRPITDATPTAKRFMDLFAGLPRAFGQYSIAPNTKADSRGKVEGRAATWSDRPLELADWEAHLNGKRGLGIVPIRDDGTVVFGALDIDRYPFDPLPVLADCYKLGIPPDRLPIEVRGGTPVLLLQRAGAGSAGAGAATVVVDAAGSRWLRDVPEAIDVRGR